MEKGTWGKTKTDQDQRGIMNRQKPTHGIFLTLTVITTTLGACSSGQGHVPPPPSRPGGTAAATAASMAGSCVPLNRPMYFSGTGLLLDTSDTLYGGAVPHESTFGSMTVSIMAGPMTGTTFVGTRRDGESVGTVFEISVPIAAAGSFPLNNLTVSGVLTLGQIDQKLILSDEEQQLPVGQAWPSAQPWQAVGQQAGAAPGMGTVGGYCVSGMAVHGNLASAASGGNAFVGDVYIYLNGSPQGFGLEF